MDFYLTLPSTASTRFFADNKAGKYKIKLPKTIFLPETEVALAIISLSDMAPNVQEYIATGRPILVQAMFFSKVYNHDGDVELPVIRLIDTGTVDASKLDENGNPTKVYIWSEDKSPGDHARYYWDQIVSEVELDLHEECQVFTKTLHSGYDVWSRFSNFVTNKLHENSQIYREF